MSCATSVSLSLAVLVTTSTPQIDCSGKTDALFAESDPALDAQGLARFLVGGTDDQVLMVDIAAGLGWTPRRLNPAASYLANADVVMAQSAMGSAPYYYRYLQRTVTTRRFVRDLDSGAR
jgi:hypothetical protein